MNTYSSGVNLHTLGAFDRWFEHAGFVNGTFFGMPHCFRFLKGSLRPEAWLKALMYVLKRFRFRKTWLRPERYVILWDEDISWR